MSLVAYPNPESQLVVQYVHGDALSGEALAERLRYQVAYLVRQYTRTSEDAEDLTQECLLRVFQCMPNLDSSRPLYPWICAIVRNVSVNWLRQRVRSQSVPLESVAETLTDETDETLIHEHLAVLEQALSGLDTLDRELLQLRYCHELGYAEIGVKSSLSADCVRKRISRALDRLQRDRKVQSLLEEDLGM